MKQDVSLRQTFLSFYHQFPYKKIQSNTSCRKNCYKFHNTKKKLQNPVSWQVSADGQRMIGHMVLRKNIDGEDILGLKIVGGKIVSSSQKGAVIEKVKRGSIADQEGHLKPGKTSNEKRNFLIKISLCTFASSFFRC